MTEYSAPVLSPEQIEARRQRKKELNKFSYYFRLQPSYVPFFQAMAEDYYQRGKIESPSIGLLGKTCLITAGNAWNRMQIQLMNQEYQKKMQQQQSQPQQVQPQPPRYQKRVSPQTKTQQQLEDELIEQTMLQPQREGQRLIPKEQYYAATAAANNATIGPEPEYDEEGEY